LPSPIVSSDIFPFEVGRGERELLKSATIEFDGGAYSCTVRNLSAAGAALDVPYAVAIAAEDIVGEQLVGVPQDKSPALRAVTDAYGAKLGIDLTPDHYVDNLSMAMSLVASTRGIALMPLYARNLLPPTVVSRPLAGVPPTIDLSLGYNEANTSPLLKTIISRIGDLKFANP